MERIHATLEISLASEKAYQKKCREKAILCTCVCVGMGADIFVICSYIYIYIYEDIAVHLYVSICVYMEI